jgi:hypothetical protein
VCSLCGDGWRFDAVELGGENSGRVKAVLHPIAASWEELYSQVADGSIDVATQDPSADDIWAGATGVYISQVLPDGSRLGRFGGEVTEFHGSGGGATTIGLRSIDGFLDDCIVAGKSDPWGITATGDTVTVFKPATSTTVTTVFTGTVANIGHPAVWATFLVTLAQGNLIGEGFTGLKSLTASPGSIGSYATSWAINWWDFKNIGAAVRELVETSPDTASVKYELVHTYSDGFWSTEMVFYPTNEFGNARDYTIKSDREAKEYGLSVDASEKATRVYGLGSGEEGNTQFSIAYDDDDTDNLPERRVSVAWKDQTIEANIDALTRGYVLDHRDPVTVPSATIMGLPDYDPNAPGFNPQKGFPGPEILKPGDTFDVEIGYGVITARDLGVRCLGVSWKLDGEDTAERVIAMQPLIRSNQSVRTQTPAKPVAPSQPIVDTPTGPTVPVDPWPKPGLVVRVTDDNLTEISGMEVSRVNPGTVVVFNDEVNEYQVRTISLKTGQRYGAYAFAHPLDDTWGDPEAIRWSKVSQVEVLADTGDNNNNRPTSGAGQPALHKFIEPRGAGGKTVNNVRLPLRFPDNESVNCETLLIHPVTDEVFLLSKEDNRTRVFSFGKLSDMGTGTTDNPGTLVRTLTSIHLASDGTHTTNGDFVLLRCAGLSDTLAFSVNDDGTTWKQVDSLDTPSMTKSEAIAVDDTCSFLTTTEGPNAPIYRVLLTKGLGAKCGTTGGSTGGGTGTPTDPAKKVPGQVLNLNGFKVTLPVGSGSKPKEIGPPQISTYELKPWFYTDNGVDVVFRANVDGVTTSNSGYPRSELRQLKGNGDLAAWSNKNETWSMECVLAFTHLPGDKPHVVGMQIHGDDNTDDLTVLRLEGSNLYVTKQDDTHYDLIDGSYTLGTFITVKVIAKKGGGIDWYLNGVKKATVSGVWSGLYFKTGAYVQANESNGTGYGEVKLRSVKIVRQT